MSDFMQALAEVNKTLEGLAPSAAPATRSVTKAEALEYIRAQTVKVSDEKDEEKARKRLEHLRGVVAELAKASWESSETATIPVFVEEQTATAEQSDTTGAASAGVGTQADGASFAAAAGAQSFAKAAAPEGLFSGLLESFDKILAGELTPSVNVIDAGVSAGPVGFWPGDVNTPSFMAEGVTKRDGAIDDWGTDGSK